MKKGLSCVHFQSDGFLPLDLFFASCSFWPYEEFSVKESETFIFLLSLLLIKAACLFFPLMLDSLSPWSISSLRSSSITKAAILFSLGF